VDLQAKRQLAEKAPFRRPTRSSGNSSGVPHEETPDQEQVIREVLSDLSSPRPMDRLVCGDVGYGKTEVAIRAAFQVVMGEAGGGARSDDDLAEQHYQTFTVASRIPRAGGEPVAFPHPEGSGGGGEGMANGSVDVVIGTHRLLQRDVTFRNLGLVVIDEEQRFGLRTRNG